MPEAASAAVVPLVSNPERRCTEAVTAFVAKVREGSYWGMFTDPGEYPAASDLALPADKARQLAETPTRLASMPDELQERLINFGYGMAERAMRSFVDPAAFKPARFPFARGI